MRRAWNILFSALCDPRALRVHVVYVVYIAREISAHLFYFNGARSPQSLNIAIAVCPLETVTLLDFVAPVTGLQLTE